MSLPSLATFIFLLPTLAVGTVQPVPANDEPTPVLETVVVSGEQPGPGLWRVSTDNDHVLWILGTLSPLPRRMSWRSADVEETIAGSQEMLAPPSVSIRTQLGFFRKVLLLPSLLAARKNPHRDSLRQMLPAESYARWLILKKKYIGRDNEVEKRRPILAARELYDNAIKRSGLDSGPLITAIATRAAERNKVPITSPNVDIVIENPRAMVKELAATALDDVECFDMTLTHIEDDIETMKLRGNAWATGDIQQLQALPYTDQGPACIAAVLGTSAIEKRGLGDLPQRVATAWLNAAKQSLEKNRQSFAMLPMAEILKPDGYVENLKKLGYHVESP